MKNSIETLSLKWSNQKLFVLDQELLPFEESWIAIQSIDHMVSVIRGLKVRGAPLIGLSALFALAQECGKRPVARDQLLDWVRQLIQSRPTAVNLKAYMDLFVRVSKSWNPITGDLVEEFARQIFLEDSQMCESMAEVGLSLISPGDAVLTHCNTGELATAGRGTALGLITNAFEKGLVSKVFVDETRPLLQGARLTAYELAKKSIPFELITDSMAAPAMAQGRVHRVFVGADRIAANGDFANKIGTYSLALSAYYHRIPFYVVAPITTFDPRTPSGAEIEIEERGPKEVQGYRDNLWALPETPVWNPAFDVTPMDFVTGWVFEFGVVTSEDFKSGRVYEHWQNNQKREEKA